MSKQSKEHIKLAETYTDTKGKSCEAAKADFLVREFSKGSRIVKRISIPMTDLKYYTDIGDFDSGGTTVAILQQRLLDCRQLLKEAGIKFQPSIQAMVRKLVAERDNFKQLVETQTAPMDSAEQIVRQDASEELEAMFIPESETRGPSREEDPAEAI